MNLLIRFLADGLVVPVVLIGAYVLLVKVPKGHRLESYARVIMAGLTALLFGELVGSFWQPDVARPFVELGVAAKAAYLVNAGFPSLHVLFCAATSLAVWFEAKQRKTAVFLLVLTILIAIGRVLALVHTPLDVAGGFVFAGFGGLWYFTAPSFSARKNSKHAV